VIRYAVLTPGLRQPGGAERHIYSLILDADPRRLRCVGVVVSGYGGVDAHLGGLIRSSDVPLVGDKAQLTRGHSLVDDRFETLSDAVLETCAEADVLLAWGSLQLGRFTGGLEIPVVCTSHCAEPGHGRPDGITHLVAVSRAATTFWGEAAGDLPVALIPNGVVVVHCFPPRESRSRQRALWDISDGQVVVGYVGRQDRIKRPEACIRALTRLPEDHVAVLVGNQSTDNTTPARWLVDLSLRLGVRRRVRFIPHQHFMGDAYGAMDCLMLASRCEADSLTLKEAMICGLPVCATRVGAIPEMEEEFGIVAAPICNPESAVELAAAVRSAVSPGGRAIAARMQQIALERWTAGAMADRWADYLEGVVDGWKVARTCGAAAG
jgi:glycosyltransferase involved in cell wall biosynthesis